MKCDKCGSCVSIEEHHLHPRFMNNPDGKGKKIWLCKYCHGIVHQTIIPKILWVHIQDFGYNFASWKHKNECIKAVERRTIQWIQEKEF
jgi:hypothetical protein